MSHITGSVGRLNPLIWVGSLNPTKKARKFKPAKPGRKFKPSGFKLPTDPVYSVVHGISLNNVFEFWEKKNDLKKWKRFFIGKINNIEFCGQESIKNLWN